MAHARFAAINLISDPIHGYLELTKRLTAAQSDAFGLGRETAAEEDLLDSPWVQRLRRISQLQSARWVFPTAEHSRFTHGLGVMHEAGLWGRALYPSLRDALEADTTAGGPAGAHAIPSRALVIETLRVAGLLHDVGHGPFAHFFDEHVLARFPAPRHPSRDPQKRLSHEDLGQVIVERRLGDLIRSLRRAPEPGAAEAAFDADEAIDPAWVSFLISKPPLADRAMPLWVRRLQPLFSGVFTVDNLDYVRRDAYMTGVETMAVDADRLRRYTFVSAEGLALYESGLGALEMFLTARLFMYQTVYFHRTVRAIDLDLAEAFWPAIRAIFGEVDPLEALDAYEALDEYALLHQASRWADGHELAAHPVPGDGRVTPAVGRLWRGIMLRRPRWRAVNEVRRDSRHGGRAEVETTLAAAARPGDRLDLAETDGQPEYARKLEGRLLVARRDGSLDSAAMGELLDRLPAVVVIGRAYRRAADRPRT